MNGRRSTAALAALAGACLLAAGCMQPGALQSEVEAEVARESAEVGRRLAGPREAGRTGISHAGRPWYGTADNSMRPLRDGDPRGVPLPAWLEERDAIAVTIGAAVPIAEAASIISAAAGIPVSVVTALTGPDGQEIEIPVRGGRAITHEGRLSALLDRIAGEYDLTWRHDGRQIRLLATDTRGWTVPLPVGSTEISASSGGLSGGGERSVSHSSSSSQDPWAALAAQLRAAVRPPARVVTVPDNGRVMVTGRPSDIAAAEGIIADWTRLYSQRITLEVGIYQIDAERSESFRAGLRMRSATDSEIAEEPGARAAGAARQAARIRAEAAAAAQAIINDDAELGLSAVAEAEAVLAEAATEEAVEAARIRLSAVRETAALSQGTAQASADALRQAAETEAGDILAAAAARPAVRFNIPGDGSASIIDVVSGRRLQLDFQALAGNDSVLAYRTASTVAQSGTPAPVIMSSVQNYVSSIETTEAGLSVDTASIDDGLSLHMVPRLIRTGDEFDIQLNLVLMQNEFVRLDHFGQVQLPSVDQRMISSQVLLKPGETLVLSGYEQASLGADRTGGLLSTGRRASSNRIMLVVMVRPTLSPA